MSADIQHESLYPHDVENAWKTREDHLLRERKMQANPTASDDEEDLPQLLRMINGSCSFPDDYFDAGNNHHFIQENNTASNAMFTGFRAGSFTEDIFDSENHSANEIVNHAELVSQNSHRMDSSFHMASPEDTTVDIYKLIVAEKQQNASSKHESSAAKFTTNVANPPPKPAHSRRSPQVEIVRKVSSRSRSSISSDPLEGSKDDTASNLMLPTMPNSMHKTGKFKEKKKFFSQPNPSIIKLSDVKMNVINRVYSGPINGCNSKDKMDPVKKASYLLFETKSKKQFSQLLSHRLERSESKLTSQDSSQTGKAMPAGRYFDALKGPELEILKDCEEALLPLDQQWPFLLRFPIGCFGICLGLGSQSILWKTLAMSQSISFLRIPLFINLILWYLAVVALVGISVVYGLKCLFYFEAVRREYHHPVRVNFFFAPWIACMFLTLGIPPRIATSIHPAVWGIFTTPILLLELKIYGQWLSGGVRRLSRVANPSTHLSLVGNFISALLASTVGLKEPAIFFWAVGCAHYLVLFVTLYQRLPISEVVTKELHPIFFLFVAAPSAASVAWKSINGSFNCVSRMAYFLALFLYSSLVVRLNFFYGFKFSLTWWAYTFPMTALANATIHYSMEVQHSITQYMAVILSFISSVVVSTLFVTTLIQATRGKLFPNDLAIAIATRRHDKRKQKGLKEGSSCSKGGSSSCQSLAIDKSKLEKCDDVVLAKERGDLLIVSNLHPKNTEIRVHTSSNENLECINNSSLLDMPSFKAYMLEK